MATDANEGNRYVYSLDSNRKWLFCILGVIQIVLPSFWQFSYRNDFSDALRFKNHRQTASFQQVNEYHIVVNERRGAMHFQLTVCTHIRYTFRLSMNRSDKYNFHDPLQSPIGEQPKLGDRKNSNSTCVYNIHIYIMKEYIFRLWLWNRFESIEQKLNYQTIDWFIELVRMPTTWPFKSFYVLSWSTRFWHITHFPMVL